VELVCLFFIFFLGLCVGSFLNVLAYRLPHSLPITGRSFCPRCKKKIPWYDNLPLVSFVFLGGKCRFCHSPISFQYPLVELVTGILFAFVFFNFYPHLILVLYYLFLICCLIIVFVSDLRYQIIPNEAVYPAMLVSFLYSFPRTSYFLLAAIGAGLFFLALHFLTRRRGIGMGDVKLSFLMGLVLGYPQVLVALYLAFLTGAATGVILILTGRKRFGQHIPFGPFLATATVTALFWGEPALKWFLARFF